MSGPLVTFRGTCVFASDGAVITSDSTLRFRERDEVEESLTAHGYGVDDVRMRPTGPDASSSSSLAGRSDRRTRTAVGERSLSVGWRREELWLDGDVLWFGERVGRRWRSPDSCCRRYPASSPQGWPPLACAVRRGGGAGERVRPP